MKTTWRWVRAVLDFGPAVAFIVIGLGQAVTVDGGGHGPLDMLTGVMPGRLAILERRVEER